MTIVVKHRKTGNEYILLAVNAVNGGGKINLPSRLNDLFPQNNAENYGLVTVCDARGNIFLSYIDDLIVSEIDGEKPSEILPEAVTSSVVEKIDEADINDFEDDSDLEPGERNFASSQASVADSDDFEDDDWI